MIRQPLAATQRLTGVRRRSLTVFALAGLPVLALACAGDEPTAATIELPVMVVNPNSGHTGTNGKSYAMDMSQELTTTVTGDPDGVGTALLTLNTGQRTVCWSLTASNIALPAIASHIHRAPAGLSGPIVLPISPPDGSGASSGCDDDVDRRLIVDILRDPTGYYVNVHTTDEPAGAIRGQLPR
ncbi:MAG: CHRD domain-containing protein [Longimicrobiales bacterium]